MKKFFLILFLLTVPLFISPRVFAHFESSDRNITVIMHIDPDDNPVPGKQENLNFLIDDAQKRFQLPQCNCTVSVLQNNRLLLKTPIVKINANQPSIWEGTIPFTFPNAGDYHIALHGTPTEPNLFQEFSVSWDFQVDANGNSRLITTPHDETFILLATAVVLFIFLIFFSIYIKRGIIDEDERENREMLSDSENS